MRKGFHIAESLFFNGNQVQVKCSLIYMDYEGRSDGRSIKSILTHVAPLKLVRKPRAWKFIEFNMYIKIYDLTAGLEIRFLCVIVFVVASGLAIGFFLGC